VPRKKPLVVVTSNRTRDVHDAIKRRCLYHWIDYPSSEKELRIVNARLPKINENLAKQVTRFMQRLRNVDFLKKPGVSETLDWAMALMCMQRQYLDEAIVNETLGCVLKYQEDFLKFKDIWSDHQKRNDFIAPSNSGITPAATNKGV
jgi:MoxR-like ATPase